MLDRYYLYRHVRDDNNEPFYIGIGTKPASSKGFRHEYKRAFSCCVTSRGCYWWRVFLKSGKQIQIDILYESNSYDIIQDKEREFIRMYGRADQGEGSLVNLTDGGVGVSGVKRSVQTKMKLSAGRIGRKHTEETKKKISVNNARHNKGVSMSEDQKKQTSAGVKKYHVNNCKKIKCVETGKIFDTIREASVIMFGIKSAKIHQALSEKYSHKSYKGYHFCYVGDDENIQYPSYFKKVFCEQTGKVYSNISDFCLQELKNKNFRSGVGRSIKKGKSFQGYTLKLCA